MPLLRLSADILLYILCRCKVQDVLKLERTCKAFRDLISNSYLWRSHLRQLDQAHAPNLPLHVDPISLPYHEIRSLVVMAIQAYENCRNDPYGKNSRSVSVDLESAIHGSTNGDITPRPRDRGFTLVPGGRYLFIHWQYGVLQLSDTTTQHAVWTYPKPTSKEAPLESLLYVDNYAVEFRADGVISAIVCARHRNDTSNDRFLKRFEINIKTLESHELSSKTIKSQNRLHVFSLAIQGDFATASCSQFRSQSFSLEIILIDFTSDQIIVFKSTRGGEMASAPSFIREHLFISCISGRRSVIRILDVRRLFASRNENCQDSSMNNPLGIETLGFEEVELKVPRCLSVKEIGLPSLCSFHWKREHERYDLITVEYRAYWPRDLRDFSNPNYSPGVNRYIFSPRSGTEGSRPILELVSSSGLEPTGFPAYNAVVSAPYAPPTLCGSVLYSVQHRRVSTPLSPKSGTMASHSYSLSALDDKGSQSSRSIKSAADDLGIPHQASLSGVDHFSGALLLFEAGNRRMRIVYPA